MNLVSSLIAVGMMSMGTAATVYYLSEPPIAMSRLSAQAQADSIVEQLSTTVRQGSYICTGTGSGNILVKDAACSSASANTLRTISVPSNCSVLDSYGGVSGTFVKCAGFGVPTDKRGDSARHGLARLVGTSPCNSDLFPTPNTKYLSGQMYLCQESENPQQDVKASDPLQLGHFDLDTYTGYSVKGLHVHAWDDKNLRGMFNLMRSDETASCNDISDISVSSVATVNSTVCGPLGVPKSIPEVLSSSQQFFLLASNTKLSPMVKVDFAYTTSSSSTPVKVSCSDDPSASSSRTFDKCFVESPSVSPPVPLKFTTGSASTGVVKLEYLVLGFTKPNPHQLAGLIPTSTGLVNGSTSLPGKGKEYRNGAFVLQAVSSLPSKLSRIQGSTLAVLKGTDVTSDLYSSIGGSCASSSSRCYTSNGGTGLSPTSLWEMSIFWHARGAQYTAGWTPDYTPLDAGSVVVYLQRASS